MAVQILGNEEFRFRRRIRKAYLQAMASARRYILIENAYFIPDRRVRQALGRAVRRGVTVAVVVASQGDVRIAEYASRSLYGQLLAAGIRIFEWPGGMMHAKTAVIDDTWAIVGSYNFDAISLLRQLEVAAVVADPRFACQLREQTLADVTRCHEVTRSEWAARPWSQKFVEALAHGVRRWL